MAVDVVMGVELLLCAACARWDGKTLCKGLEGQRITQMPINAFQTPIDNQGVVKA